MTRSKRKLIAEETLQIIDSGNYESPSGSNVSIRESIASAIAGTQLFRPDDFESLNVEAADHEMQIEVFNETKRSLAAKPCRTAERCAFAV